MKKRPFLFFFVKSISQRRGRVAIASAAVMLAVALVTAMSGVTFGVREKLGAELKAYGANIIVSPRKGTDFPSDALEKISALPSVEEATGQVLGATSVDRQTIEVIGLDTGRLASMGWRIFGRWPERDGEILAGINLKTALNLREGQRITAEHDGRRTELRISGFIERGGVEDRALIMSLKNAWELTGNEGRLHVILVRGKSGHLEMAGDGVRSVLSGAAVKTLRQVALAEESLLAKIQLLMMLVTGVVVFASGISVTSTMGANVLERREEIGLMKALGATRRDISSFYMAEALLIGALGGVSGFAVGFLSAQAISKGAFNSFIAMPLLIPAAALAMGLAVSVVSSYFPVRSAMQYDPAMILRGE
ncbi:MAG: ABC transporter permease [Thermodesulfovibrionales bacterium]